MEAKLIIIYSASHYGWEQMAEEYQWLDFESFIERIKILFSDIVCEEPTVEEIEGEVQNETSRYILTWEDGMDECVRIYEKL